MKRKFQKQKKRTSLKRCDNNLIEEIIRNEFGDKISGIEIEDTVTENKLENLDELKEDMKIIIRYILNLKRQVSFTAHYKILSNRRIELLGVPICSVAQVERLEDTSIYIDDAVKSANRIAELLSDALAQNT